MPAQLSARSTTQERREETLFATSVVGSQMSSPRAAHCQVNRSTIGVRRSQRMAAAWQGSHAIAQRNFRRILGNRLLGTGAPHTIKYVDYINK